MYNVWHLCWMWLPYANTHEILLLMLESKYYHILKHMTFKTDCSLITLRLTKVKMPVTYVTVNWVILTTNRCFQLLRRIPLTLFSLAQSIYCGKTIAYWDLIYSLFNHKLHFVDYLDIVFWMSKNISHTDVLFAWTRYYKLFACPTSDFRPSYWLCLTLSPPNLKISFGTTFIFSNKRVFRKAIQISQSCL